ncbi:MAG: hypothetical protein M3Q64_01465 [bacterium]|nr:hypothetical protein [bacterium]
MNGKSTTFQSLCQHVDDAKTGIWDIISEGNAIEEALGVIARNQVHTDALIYESIPLFRKNGFVIKLRKDVLDRITTYDFNCIIRRLRVKYFNFAPEDSNESQYISIIDRERLETDPETEIHSIIIGR